MVKYALKPRGKNPSGLLFFSRGINKGKSKLFVKKIHRQGVITGSMSVKKQLHLCTVVVLSLHTQLRIQN